MSDAEGTSAYVLEQWKPGNRKGDATVRVSAVDHKVGKAVPSQAAFAKQFPPGCRLVRRATGEIVRQS